MITFNSIPVTIRTVGSAIEFDSSRAVNGIYRVNNRVLLIGQRRATGAVQALVPTRIDMADAAIAAFGRGSMLARMAKFFKAADPISECWAIAVDDLVGGTAATSTITVTGPATAAGTLPLMIAGQSVNVAVASADTATTIATAIVAAVTQAADLPVTAASAAGVVTLTARHKGTCGNDIDVRANYYTGQQTPAGVALAFAAVTSGAGDPDYSTLTAILGDAEIGRSSWAPPARRS